MKKRSYARQTVAIFTALSLSIAALGLAYLSIERSRLRSELFRRLESIADLKVGGVGDWKRTVEEAGAAAALPTQSDNPMRRLLENGASAGANTDMWTYAAFLRTTYGYRAVRLYRRTAKGMERAFSFPPSLDSAGADAFDDPAGAPVDRPSLGDFYQVPSDGRPAISLRVPILPRAGADRQESDLLVLEIDPSRNLYPFIRGWPIESASGECLLVRKDGDSVLFLNDLRFARDAAFRLKLPIDDSGELPAAMAVSGRQGGVEGIDYRGKRVLAWLRSVPGTDWSLIAKMDRQEALAPLSPIQAVIVFAVAALIVSAGFSVFAVRRRFLTLLELRASRAEISRLETSARFEYLTRFANDAILLLDGDQIVREANGSALKLYGVERDALVGADFRAFQTEAAPYEEELKANRAAETSDGYRFQTRHVRGNGDFIWVDVSARAFSESAERFVQVIVRDMSEAKRAHDALRASMAEKEVLLKELHHRTKNNMQVISSLLVLKAAELEDERIRGAFMEMVGRIRSMALVHEKLYQSGDLSRIELGQYVKDLSELVLEELGGEGIRLAVSLGDGPVPVPIDTAIPCGLVLNELITNAVKHAFDGQRDKRIAVDLDSESGWTRLSVADNGKGMPEGFDAQEQGRMGWQTIAALVETQMGGEVSISRDRGTTVVIRFPAAASNKGQ